MSLSRRNFVLASAAAAALGPRTVRAQGAANTPDYLIVCLADGGWDPVYAFDPKEMGNGLVDGPWVSQPPGLEYQQVFNHNQRIQLNDVERPAVTGFFQQWGDRAAVINGLWTGSIVHEPCRVRLLTGTTQKINPDWATIFGYLRGAESPIGSVDFSGLSYPGYLAASTGRVGARSQLKALLDPEEVFPEPTWADYQLPLFSPTLDEQYAMREVLEQRAARFRSLRGGGANDARIDDLLTSLDRRERLIADGPSLVGGLTLGTKPTFQSQALLACDLLEKGLCRAVTLRADSDFDTHSLNASQHSYYQSLFATLNSLLNELTVRQVDGVPLLERTLVVVLSEMGRTPKLNANSGKDHWSHTSEMVIGAGVQGGWTMGGTDEIVESLYVDLKTGETTGSPLDPGATGTRLKYDNFAAGILAHLGIDPEEYYPTIAPFTAWSSWV